jgi:hypothetical protein
MIFLARINARVQHSAYRGCSHRRKGATIEKAWIYRSPIPVGGEEGDLLLIHMKIIHIYIQYLPSLRLEEGEGGVSTLW